MTWNELIFYGFCSYIMVKLKHTFRFFSNDLIKITHITETKGFV